MSNKAYVVTTGCYSSYTIEGVFSDRALADRFAVECDGEVEEYTVDQRQADVMQKVYYVRLDADGHLNSRNYRHEVAPPTAFKASSGSSDNSYFWGESSDGFERAQKLAAEYRQSFLRQHAAGGLRWLYRLTVSLETGEIIFQQKRWLVPDDPGEDQQNDVYINQGIVRYTSPHSFADCIDKITQLRKRIEAAFAA